MFANEDNIVNSKDWGNDKWLTFFQTRLQQMRSKKEDFNILFDDYESQMNAISYYDNLWELQVNVPLEQNLTEIYMWRTAWKVLYDIIPDGQADVDQLQPARFAMMFFLDWNTKNNFWKENKDFRYNKATYWTWIRFTWIRSIKDYIHKLKEWAELSSAEDVMNEANFDKIINENWEFFPKSIHPKDFYVDDAAYGQTDIQDAADCIYKETISFSEFQIRFEKNKSVIQENVKQVGAWTDEDKTNIHKYDNLTDQVVMYYYFDRISKKYMIMANNQYLIYNGLYLYDDSKLPFDMVQHYTDNNCIWGRGIPAKIGYIKAYKSEILQDILVWAEMGSWVHFLAWNDDEIGQDWEIWGRWVNILRSTGWAESMQQVSMQPNLTYFTNVLALLDELVVQDTWDNTKSPIDASSDKVWIVEIMEANKAVRQASVDENYNIWLDNVLTMTLSRIKQFAPSLLSDKIYDSEWKLLKATFPRIRIDWYEVEEKEGKQVFTESLWKFWYFDLKPDVVQWVWVKITTSSTNSMMPILERQRVAEYVNNVKILAEVAQLDPAMMEKLKESVNFEDLMAWMWDAYGTDSKLKSMTDKDKIKEEQKKMIQEMKEKFKITSNPIPNEANQFEEQGIQQIPGVNQQAWEQATTNEPLQNPISQIPWVV